MTKKRQTLKAGRAAENARRRKQWQLETANFKEQSYVLVRASQWDKPGSSALKWSSQFDDGANTLLGAVVGYKNWRAGCLVIVLVAELHEDPSVVVWVHQDALVPWGGGGYPPATVPILQVPEPPPVGAAIAAASKSTVLENSDDSVPCARKQIAGSMDSLATAAVAMVSQQPVAAQTMSSPWAAQAMSSPWARINHRIATERRQSKCS